MHMRGATEALGKWLQAAAPQSCIEQFVSDSELASL